MKFLVFADLHYMKGMYMTPVESLEAIFARAAEEKVDFVFQMGDFSNSCAASPEIIRPYLENQYGLPVYGVFGNHELEKRGNTLSSVAAVLSNRAVNFATEEDGTPAGYYYTDIGNFRLIALDTNYMYHPGEDKWYHNSAETWPYVKDTIFTYSLGRSQLAWLRETVAETARQNRKAIVFSHAALSGLWSSTPDAEKAREIFAAFPGTILMALNGHLHTDRFAVRDGVAYFDVNTVHNGFWKPQQEHHYKEEHTYLYTDYDENGVKGATEPRSLTALRQGKNTWSFTEPTSAIVTVTESGEITVEGCRTEWAYGVTPPTDSDAVYAGIRDRKVKL